VRSDHFPANGSAFLVAELEAIVESLVFDKDEELGFL
jgi:hypothetical protein